MRKYNCKEFEAAKAQCNRENYLDALYLVIKSLGISVAHVRSGENVKEEMLQTAWMISHIRSTLYKDLADYDQATIRLENFTISVVGNSIYDVYTDTYADTEEEICFQGRVLERVRRTIERAFRTSSVEEKPEISYAENDRQLEHGLRRHAAYLDD